MDHSKGVRQTDTRDYGTLFKRQEDATTGFNLTEKEDRLPKVEEVDEKSQASDSSNDKSEDEA